MSIALVFPHKNNTSSKKICQDFIFKSIDKSTLIEYTIINLLVKCCRRVRLSLQKTLSALSDATRRKILKLLKSESLNAGEIAKKFDISAPAISKHLSILKSADLIRDNRNGKYIIYEINTSVLEEILLWIKDIKGDKK